MTSLAHPKIGLRAVIRLFKWQTFEFEFLFH